ncbi:MAG: LysE family translocator, partial [Pseudomonadota bacterium]
MQAMTQEMLIALSLFCFITSATPGPNNMMLLASGAKFGFRRS